MVDLCPYSCTAPQCDRANQPFHTLSEYLDHEIKVHTLGLTSSIPGHCKRERGRSVVCIFCGDQTDTGTGRNGRGRHVGRHMEEIAFTVVSKPYEKWEFYSDTASFEAIYRDVYAHNRPRKRRAGRPRKPKHAKTVHREASSADAVKHHIPAGYQLKNWDPEEEPILLLGSVFDVNSLGKWIYDWSVFCHGAGTPITEMAGELWLLLIKLSAKRQRAEVRAPKIRDEDSRQLVEEFLDSGDRFWHKLIALLKSCETWMLKAAKSTASGAQKVGTSVKLGEESGRSFIATMFGRERTLEATEKLMQSIRLWNLRFDANCQEILSDR